MALSMENKTNKKRPVNETGTSGPSAQKTARSSFGSTTTSRQKRSNVLKNPKKPEVRVPGQKFLTFPLNPGTARQAMILSEIIGKPVSMRRR